MKEECIALVKAFQNDINAEALLKYGIVYKKLPVSSQRAIRQVVKEYYIQKIHDMTEDD
jgi:hypothetical protein